MKSLVIFIILTSWWCVEVGRGENPAAFIMYKVSQLDNLNHNGQPLFPLPTSHSPVISQPSRDQHPQDVKGPKQRIHSSADTARKFWASPTGQWIKCLWECIQGLAPTIKIREVEVSAEKAMASLTSSCSQKAFFNSGKYYHLIFHFPYNTELYKPLAPSESSFFPVSRNPHYLYSGADHFHCSLHKVAGHNRWCVFCSGHNGHDYYSVFTFSSGI